MSDAPANTGSNGLPTSPHREHTVPVRGEAQPEMSQTDVLAGIEGLLEAEDQPKRREPKRPVVVQQDQSDTSQRDTSHGEAPDDAGPEEVTGTEETAEEGEPDDAQEDDQSDHSIEPPTSWSKDEKELFLQLPPEAQAVIARRESQQNKAFTTKTQEIADHRKALEASFSAIQSERQQYAQERAQYGQSLQQLLMVAMPEAEKFARIDWQRLAADSPADYVRLTAERDALRGRVGAIQGELARVEQQRQQDIAQQQHDYAQQFGKLKEAEGQKLAEKLPVFADAEKGKKYAGELRQWLQEKGFSAQEVGQVIDHRIILVADIAFQAERAARARRTAETKRSDVAPTVQRPGSTQGRETQTGRRRQEKFEQLRRSGSQQDALSYLMDIL